MTADNKRSLLTFKGFFSALPDFLTASVFVYVWLYAPERPHLVKTMMLVMLIEFLVVHSAGFLGAIVFGNLSRSAKTKAVLGLGSIYALFALAFSAGFNSIWPVFWIVWLLLSKLVVIWFGEGTSDRQKARMMGEWAAGVAFYVLGVFITLMPIIPRFSLTPEFVSTLSIEGSGVWIEQPHTVIAFGVIYFVAIGVTKMLLVRSN